MGGSVGSGKTALIEKLCKALRDEYEIAVVTNNIFTLEEDLTRTGLLDGYQTNGSLYVVADGMDPELKRQVDALGNEHVLLAVGNVRPDLMVVRFLGDGMMEMTAMMQSV